MDDPVVVVSAARTPLGGFQGELQSLAAPRLGSAAIRAAVERAGVAPAEVQEVIMGNVLSAGLGQAPARQAALGAGLPAGAGCTTVNKVCGSGMKALMFAHDLLLAGSAQVVVAGGMESMSNAPYLIAKARRGLRLGHGELKDHMFLDGLEDAYEHGRLMGSFAEDCARHYGFTRAAQDAYAIESVARAQRTAREGGFAREIVPVEIEEGGAARCLAEDEHPNKVRVDRVASLRPAFREGGTVTAANSSSIADGAAALVLMRRSAAERRGIAPLAAIRAHATHAQAPGWFTTAPVGAVRALLARAGWEAGAVDLYEINEAFAVVAMAAMRELALPRERLNVHGGACALGHPIGASGARIVVTLLAALERHALARGVACLCIGGGEATALALERL
ncbi:MAG: acetyl-CoA C-acyltransferase [Burkholderiales bacterium]|nr:acetyl-CoA C-acyltransferase [Burkholderiales bacterium]